MSMTTNRDNFFQTDATHAKNASRDAKSTNTFGNPLRLKSKILALVADPSAPLTCVFIAESAGKVRRVNIDSASVTKSYSGPTAPVTCLSATTKLVAAGSWDRAIYQWDIATGKPGGPTLKGHSDFVKAIVYATIGTTTILVSGGADKKLIVWDAETGNMLYSLTDSLTPMGHVQHLAVDPQSVSADSVVIVSAGSDPHVRRWRLTLTGGEKLTEQFDGADAAKERPTIKVHETGVYRVLFAKDDEADLWTASADGTAKCLARGKSFTEDDSITHGDHVRTIGVTDEFVVTAGRDEDVKVWDRASGKLVASLFGHFDEVTDLVIAVDGTLKERVVSVGLDGTVRTWPIDRREWAAMESDMQRAREGVVVVEVEPEEGTGMTAEEEAELAALMADD